MIQHCRVTGRWLTIEYGVSAFILTGDNPELVEFFAKEVDPATGELVASSR